MELISPKAVLRRIAPEALQQWLWPSILLVTAILVWQTGTTLLGVPDYVLPSPTRIWIEIKNNLGDLVSNSAITFGEAAAGFLLANVLSFLFAILFCYSPLFEKSTYPYMVALKSVPIVALAPLITLWLGEGAAGKVVMAALITFFPMVVNATQGLKAVDPLAMDVMRSLSATERQILVRLRIPNALPYILSALKISAPLSIVGAIVAELTAASSGIGYLILVAAYRVQTPLLFACILFAAFGGIAFFGAAALVEWLTTRRRCREIHLPAKLMSYLREGLEVSEVTAANVNRAGTIEKFRDAVRWPHDSPHLERLAASSKPRLRHLAYALFHKPIRSGDAGALQPLLDAWRRSQHLSGPEQFQERMALMWQILDFDKLADEWHCEIYRFVSANWDYFRRRTLNWSTAGDTTAMLDVYRRRLANPEYPDSKRWIYLLQTTLAGDRESALTLASPFAHAPHFLVRAVAQAILCAPADRWNDSAFLGPPADEVCSVLTS